MPVLAGLFIGAVAGFFLGLVYAAIHFLTGGYPDANGNTISLLSALSTYSASFALTGLIAGLGWRLLKSRLGAGFLLSVALVPVFLLFTSLYGGGDGVDWLLVLIGSLLVGAPLGILIRADLVSKGWVTSEGVARPKG